MHKKRVHCIIDTQMYEIRFNDIWMLHTGIQINRVGVKCYLKENHETFGGILSKKGFSKNHMH